MTQKIYHYPIWIRLWHLINAILCLLLIITGISMQYSGQNDFLLRFDIAVSIHNICGILLTINYLQFFIGNIITKNFRFYKIKRKEIKGQILKQIKFCWYIQGRKCSIYCKFRKKIQSFATNFLCFNNVFSCTTYIFNWVGNVIPGSYYTQIL